MPATTTTDRARAAPGADARAGSSQAIQSACARRPFGTDASGSARRRGAISPYQERSTRSRSTSSAAARSHAPRQLRCSATPFDRAYRHRSGHGLSGNTSARAARPIARPSRSSSARSSAPLDREGRAIGRAARADVFPESPCPERWRYARSNGVALHRSWRGACDRAAAELVERDRVLRSWYGEIAPRRRALPDASVPNGLRAHADWIACELPARASAPGAARALSVVVVAGIPRQASTPLVYGFGAGAGARAAARAASEAVQRFGFLFGEDIPREPPRPSPTPDFHQEFFLYPPSHELFVAWLDG